MAREEFTIRINKKGEIFLEVEGMPVRQVKDLIKYFEETLGPAQQVEAEGGDATGGVQIDEEFGREPEEEPEEEQKQRSNRLFRPGD